MNSPIDRWSIAEVPAAFAEISALADANGYAATLFGSTLKSGDGRDLDVVMISRYEAIRSEREEDKPNWRTFICQFGGEIVKRFDREERGNFSFEVMRGGRLYHFIFGRF